MSISKKNWKLNNRNLIKMITNLKMNGKNYMIILIVQKIKLKINDITILHILEKPCF